MTAGLKRILIAPDSFKGSLSASEAAAAMRLGILRVLPQADIVCYPMADGGEGTLDSILAALGGERRQLEISAASDGKIVAEYGVLQQAGKSVAIIEAAQVVGLTLPQTASVSVMQRSSVGLGELLRHALDAGIRRFMIGLGGSATNDGGAGFLQGLGLQLLDCEGQSLPPTPEGLVPLAVIDATHFDTRLADSQIQILSDVDNILCGPQGATYVFGPQKGVQPQQLHALDASLKRYASLLEQQNRPGLSLQAGTGAAGGLGFALQWLGGAYRFGTGAIDPAQQTTTLQLTERMQGWLGGGRDVSLTIGGADGLHPSVKQRADWLWSLSPLTLPHGMVSALLAEQLYRD